MTAKVVFVGLGLLLCGVVALVGMDSCRKKTGSQNEIQSAIHQGEANAHVSQAQAIPEHKAELAQAQADVAGARAEVERLRRLVAAQRPSGVPHPVVLDPAVQPTVAPDHRDELLAADAVLIADQDEQIKVLKVALSDEQRRSSEFREAFDAERKATAAQAAATKAWKEAVTTSKWRGRVEGFAAGVALGYFGGKR